jgi:hypothetical protein
VQYLGWWCNGLQIIGELYFELACSWGSRTQVGVMQLLRL